MDNACARKEFGQSSATEVVLSDVERADLVECINEVVFNISGIDRNDIDSTSNAYRSSFFARHIQSRLNAYLPNTVSVEGGEYIYYILGETATEFYSEKGGEDLLFDRKYPIQEDLGKLFGVQGLKGEQINRGRNLTDLAVCFARKINGILQDPKHNKFILSGHQTRAEGGANNAAYPLLDGKKEWVLRGADLVQARNSASGPGVTHE